MNTYKFRVYSLSVQDFLETPDGLNFVTGYEPEAEKLEVLPGTDFVNKPGFIFQQRVGLDAAGTEVYTGDLLDLEGETVLVDHSLGGFEISYGKKVGDFRDLEV